MLRLITGRMGSGKTAHIYNRIKECADKGGEAIFIVPEQYSFKAEKTVLEMFGERDADKVNVVSFTFLAQKILKKYGINSKAAVDDSTRALMMSLALENVSDELKIYGRHRYSASVISQMLDIIREFHQCSVSFDMLRETAGTMNDGILRSKLCDLAIIGDAYTALVERSFFDDECAFDKLCTAVDEHGDFRGKTFFFDGFRGYTEQQLKVIERMLVQADDVYITLTVNDKSDDDFGAFAHTQRTRRKLIRLAEKNSVRIAPPEIAVLPDEQRYSNDEMKLLERELYGGGTEIYGKETEYIILCSAEDFESECEYVAHTVKKLIRTEGLRCRDIAVISRNEDDYSRRIRSELKKYGIPVFDDRRSPIVTQPLVEFILSSVDIAVNGFSCDSVMRVLKTGLTPLDIQQISDVENYALLWNINGNKWLHDWTGHPKGLGEIFREEDVKTLAYLNECRKTAVGALQNFRKEMSECDGLKAAKAIYDLLIKTGVPENLKALAQKLNEKGDTDSAAEQGKIWDVVIDILDRIAYALEDVRMTPKRFAELLELIVSMYTVGDLPQGLDEVVIGSADRVKTSVPKVVFAVGMNDGVFPGVPVSNGILSDNERKILADHSLKIDDGIEERMMEERFIVYNTLCSPMERLYVSYLRKDIKGAQTAHSEAVTQLKRIFPKIKTEDTVTTEKIDFIEGELPAFELMAKLYQQGGTEYKTLEKYFASRPEYRERLRALKRAAEKREFEISDKDISKRLFGKDMYMSASRVDVFHSCPFEYFCKYGIGAKPRKVAELDPMQRGTAIHYILEKLIEAYGSDELCKMEKSERDRCVNEMTEEYLKDILAAGVSMSDRFNYLFRQLGSVVCEVVDRLVAEFSVSEFKPVAFELKIDNDGEVPTYNIPIADGGELKIKGSVDRVDIMNAEDADYVRVVDYKSSGKKFDLNEVFCGLNMQMLIYLFAIWRSGFRDYKNVKPAGILYMPVSAPFVEVERDADDKEIAKQKQKAAKMSGMVLDDSRIVYSMDSRTGGDIIPASIGKDGACKGTLISVKQMGLLMKRVEKILSEMGESLHNGVIKASPAKSAASTSKYHDVCKYCDYKDVCGIDDNSPRREIENKTHEESLVELGGEDDAEVDA